MSLGREAGQGTKVVEVAAEAPLVTTADATPTPPSAVRKPPTVAF